MRATCYLLSFIVLSHTMLYQEEWLDIGSNWAEIKNMAVNLVVGLGL